MDRKFIEAVGHFVEKLRVAIEVYQRTLIDNISSVDECTNGRMKCLTSNARKKSKASEVDAQYRNIFIAYQRYSVEHGAIAAKTDEKIY